MSPQRPLSEFVKAPEVSTTALHLEWHEVRRRVRRHRQVRGAAAVVGALAVVGVVAALALRPVSAEPFTVGQLAVALEKPRTLRLVEGSEVSVAPGGAVQLATEEAAEVVVLLERGTASFDVAKKPTRRFVVKADAVEVRVVGTKFTVYRDGHQVEVTVLRGIVEVREGEQVTRLEKGQRWSTEEAGTESETEGEDLAPATLEPEGERAGVRGERPRRTTHRQRQAPREPSVVAPTAPVQPEPPLPPVVKPEATEPTPADAFTAAMRARADGHAKDAIRGFQQVCERWPSSAYAPMSAFEWGRLALDAEDDPRQTARAFERTLELATSASLIEDALARLTEAYARYDAGSCRRVQADYLRRFPGGSHVRGVTRACPP